MKKYILFTFILLSQLSYSQYRRIKLSSLSFEVPMEVTKGNKVSRSTEGLSSYAWNRLRDDSTSYNYNYSYRYHYGIFEFRESSKEDIYEWLVTEYSPRYTKRKEEKYFNHEVFLNIENGVLKNHLTGITNDARKGIRKLTLVYKLDETTQFLASIKSAGTPDRFLDLQDSLAKILGTIEYTPPTIPKHKGVSQKGELKDKTQHMVINLPMALSNDFNNPVIEKTSDGGMYVVFAHSHGSEIFRLNKNLKIESHEHFGKIIHDIKVHDNEFFSVSSIDYNLLTYGIYPSLYLTKHDKNGKVLFWQTVLKKYKLKKPGDQVFDFYSRDNVCLEIADSVGIVYFNAEKKFMDWQTGQSGAYKTFSLEAGFLKKGEKDLWHVSHCFAQKSIADGDHAYLFSLGDNYPRTLNLSKVNITMHKDSTDTTSFWQEDLFKLSGNPGDNYIGDSHISDPIVYKGKLYIAIETEVGAKAKIEDNPYSVNRGNNDIFLVSCTLEGEDVKVKQITKTKHIEEVNPKIIEHNGLILMVYTEVKYSRVGEPTTFGDKYIYIDERSNRTSSLEDLNSYYHNEIIEDYRMPDSPTNRDGNSMIRLDDGRIIWLRLLKNTRQLEIISFNKD